MKENESGVDYLNRKSQVQHEFDCEHGIKDIGFRELFLDERCGILKSYADAACYPPISEDPFGILFNPEHTRRTSKYLNLRHEIEVELDHEFCGYYISQFEEFMREYKQKNMKSF